MPGCRGPQVPRTTIRTEPAAYASRDRSALVSGKTDARAMAVQRTAESTDHLSVRFIIASNHPVIKVQKSSVVGQSEQPNPCTLFLDDARII